MTSVSRLNGTLKPPERNPIERKENMSILKTTFSAIAFAVGGIALQAQVNETPATIFLNQGGNPQGYIQGSKPGAILFATSPGGPGKTYNLTDLKGTGNDKGIRLEERGEALGNARATFSKGDYLNAAKAFGEVADAYGFILHIPRNFASEAKFFQIESLRRAGRFQAIGPLLNTPAGRSIDTMLSDRYKNLAKYHKLWAVYGSGDMAKLETELATYQDPVVGKASLLPTPNFKKFPQSELVQLAFMRGKLYDSKGEKDKALQDYYRVFSFTFGKEPFLTKQAMGAAMVIKSQNPALKSENPKIKETATRQMQSVAYIFSQRFPETTMPPQFQEFAVRPKIDVVLAKPAAEEPKEEKKEEKKEEAKDDKKPDAPKGKAKKRKAKKGKK